MASEAEADERSLQQFGNLRIGDLLPEEVKTDRLRSWQTRRYCQVKPSLLSITRNSSLDQRAEDRVIKVDKPDFATTALLKCVLDRLDADLAMATLLDDTTQYFIAGASRSNKTSAAVSLESAKWYGCSSISHVGGLCERTLRLAEKPVYEELNMQDAGHTKVLPIVDGTLASFKSYAGAPIRTPDGKSIGTIFVMREQSVVQEMDQEQVEFLTETANQCMALLEQAVQALEHQRMLKYHDAVAALMSVQIGTPTMAPIDSPSDSLHQGQLSGLAELYSRASDLLLGSFGFSGAIVQEVRLHATTSYNNLSNGASSSTRRLAQSLEHGTTAPGPIPENLLAILINNWPKGDIFSISSSRNRKPCLKPASNVFDSLDESTAENIGCALHSVFPEAQQILFTPLWSVQARRISAVAIGWATDWSRVYSKTSDLSPMASFCMALVTQANRLEVQHIESVKSDFLGSVSHEMRSPLHGMLASVELLFATQCTSSQLDLLDSALSSGRQLLDTIDQVLEFSQISTRSPSDVSSADTVDFRELCEGIINDVVLRLSFPGSPTGPASKPGDEYKWETLDARAQGSPDGAVMVLFDTSLPRHLPFAHVGKFRTILWNLLTNAIKYTYTGCIRVSLSLARSTRNRDLESVFLTVLDSGRGMSTRYLEEHAFVPFSQARQIEAGLGLGLSLVKRTTDSLNGVVRVESDERVGTAVKVELPLEWAASRGRSMSASTDTSVPALTLASQEPTLRAQFYCPTESNDNTRSKRLHEQLLESLSSTLRDSLGIEVQPWRQGTKPDMVIIHESDLDRSDDLTMDQRSFKTLVLSSDELSSKSLASRSDTDNEVVLKGSLLPTRVIKAVESLFPDLQALVRNDSRSASDTPHDTADTQRSTTPLSRPVPNGWSMKQDGQTSDRSMTKVKDTTSCQDRFGERRPKMLIVDDNAVNLKVLRMYMTKCGITDCTAVDGGRAAIDAYRSMLEPGEKAFDIIFMDLSMPECDGFEATAAIRELEANDDAQRRANIIALTGLVSAKDQDAAFGAGVDEYVTKPAKIKDIRDRIEVWVERKANSSDSASIDAMVQE